MNQAPGVRGLAGVHNRGGATELWPGAHAFVEAAFRDGAVQPTGTAISKILPGLPLR